ISERDAELEHQKAREERRHQDERRRDRDQGRDLELPFRCQAGHTRITAVLPNRPCGRSTSTIAITAKGTPTFSSEPMKLTNVAPRLSATPTTSPPTIAPTGESQPPRVAAA